MSQATKKAYTTVPPTTDTDYWLLKSTEGKTQVFTPIDKDLHRELLVKLRQKTVTVKLKPGEWRRTIHGQIISK